MSKMPWVKLYTDFLDDRKIGPLSDALKLRFIQLVLVSGECDADGYILDGNGALSVKDIAWRLRMDPEQLGQEISELISAGLLSEDIDTGALLIVNFSKRQGRSQSEKREQWREAQARKRGQSDDKDEDHKDVIDESSMTPPPRVEKTRQEKTRGKAANPPKSPPANPERAEIVKHFLVKTGLPAPKTDNAHIKATQKLWWTPADEIVELSANNADVGRQLVDKALSRLQDVTVSDLNSIIKTVRAIYGENNRVGSERKFSEVY